MRRSDGLFDWIDHHVTRAAVIARRISRHGNVCRDEQGGNGEEVGLRRAEPARGYGVHRQVRGRPSELSRWYRHASSCLQVGGSLSSPDALVGWWWWWRGGGQHPLRKFECQSPSPPPSAGAPSQRSIVTSCVARRRRRRRRRRRLCRNWETSRGDEAVAAASTMSPVGWGSVREAYRFSREDV